MIALRFYKPATIIDVILYRTTQLLKYQVSILKPHDVEDRGALNWLRKKAAPFNGRSYRRDAIVFLATFGKKFSRTQTSAGRGGCCTAIAIRRPSGCTRTFQRFTPRLTRFGDSRPSTGIHHCSGLA